MYKKILIATDGSELAQKGLEHGCALAKQLGAPVHIVTVTEPSVPLAATTTAAWVPAYDPTELNKAKGTSATNLLADARKSAEGHGLTVTTEHVAERYPAEGIVESAQQCGADLIVVASHGRRGLGRLLLGSQATEVLTHSTIPVLVVK
ncbi:universal stress protein [Devosia pacifica]|uniref:Universal stress protein n=1 Tax=Devosia pacifica TaxID=1335967 RepID=A0A918RTX7_9HYPH|nr:universal stress protein [Devosia pacifica]GHA10896.1 universal stress protein [Devosia pacifica]